MSLGQTSARAHRAGCGRERRDRLRDGLSPDRFRPESRFPPDHRYPPQRRNQHSIEAAVQPPTRLHRAKAAARQSPCLPVRNPRPCQAFPCPARPSSLAAEHCSRPTDLGVWHARIHQCPTRWARPGWLRNVGILRPNPGRHVVTRCGWRRPEFAREAPATRYRLGLVGRQGIEVVAHRCHRHKNVPRPALADDGSQNRLRAIP